MCQSINQQLTIAKTTNNRGYTIIELMIAASLGVIVVTMILSTVTKTLWVVEEVKASGEILESAQYISGLLSQEIGMAGFYGNFDYSFTVAVTPLDICQPVNKANINRAIPFPITSLNNVVNGYKLCGGETLLSGTDVILVRRSSVAKQSPKNKLKAKQLYIQGSVDSPNPVIDQGENSAAFNLKQGSEVVPVRAWQQTLYFVSKDNTFKRRRFLKGKYLRSEPLIDGVEDFQVEYALDSSIDATSCRENFLSPPLSDEQWRRVVAVRFYLLVRSNWQGVKQKDKVLQYANKTYEIQDGGYYKLIKVLVPLMNRMPEREVFEIDL